MCWRPSCVLAASITAFAYDITTEHWQVRVDIARQEYWDNGGKEYLYLTWWWY